MSPDDPKTLPFWSREPLLGEGEIFSALGDSRGSSLFLGKFTMAEVMAVLGKKSFIKEAHKRRLWPLVTDLDSTEYPCQRFRVFTRKASPETLVVDLKIRESVYSPRDVSGSGTKLRDYPALFLEWLTLQNPTAAFTTKRGALPGQHYPGLGLSRKIVDIFSYLAKVTRKEAILAFPAYYHNALLFSRYFHFVNPRKEAEVQSIRRTFAHMPIRSLAWAVHLNCLRTNGGKVYEWLSEEQVAPLVRDLRDYFDTKAYRDAVKRHIADFRFTLDAADYERKIGPLERLAP
jgi:hypothetical protein